MPQKKLLQESLGLIQSESESGAVKIAQLKACKNEKKVKRKGEGRKPNDAEVEEELFKWILDLCSRRHLRVSNRMI